MGVQIQIGDDLGLQQRDRVTGDGIAKAWMEFLGHRGAADDPAALEHGHLQPGGGEVRRAHEAVVTAADDQRITAARPLSHDSSPAAVPAAAGSRE